MKRVLKKTFAMALTIAMVLSLGVSALATATETGSSVQSSLSGTVTNEGAMPAEVLRFIVAAPSANDFDLIVDPHDLIRLSTAAEKAKATYNTGTFEEGAYAFFKKVEDGETSYGKESKTLTITNKSSTPITVDLTATLKRSATATDGINKITLVDTEAELSSLTKKPGLYLAVKEDSTETPVSQNAFGDLTVTIDATASTYVTGATFEWVDGVSNKLKKYLNDTINSSNHATDQFTVGGAAANAGAGTDGNISIAAPTAWGTSGTTAGVSSDAETKLAASVTGNTRVLTISVPDNNKAVAVAKITFYFNMDEVNKAGSTPSGNITLGKWDGNPYAKIETQADKKDKAYSVQANANGGYDNVLDTTLENDTFPKKAFNLKAAINRDDAWDDVSGSSLNGAINVTWKINQYITPVAPILTVEAAGTKTNEIVKVNFSGGKGEYYVKDLLSVTYTDNSGKATTTENSGKTSGTPAVTDSLRISTPIDATTHAGQFELKAISKMFTGTAPDLTPVTDCKAVFLMTNADGKVKTQEVAFNFAEEG